MSTGLKANNDGSAAIQVGGTDYIQISSTGNVTIPQSQTISGNLTVTGTITAGAGTPYVIQSYTSPATWTKPTGLKAVRVTVLGGGGAGGSGITQTPTPVTSRGAGGGSGAYAQAYYDAPAIPGPLTITAGAGTNSFGALVSCTGGAVGGNSTNSTTAGVGGAGGSYTPSPATIIASNGFTGADSAGSSNVSFNSGTGSGANTFLGLGYGGLAGAGGTPATTYPGQAGLRYGSGGGGGYRTTPAPTGTSGPGGAGAPGIVIVEEFY